MNSQKTNKKMQIVRDMIEDQFPNVSVSMKESLAKEYYEKLSDGVFSEIEQKMQEELDD